MIAGTRRWVGMVRACNGPVTALFSAIHPGLQAASKATALTGPEARWVTVPVAVCRSAPVQWAWLHDGWQPVQARHVVIVHGAGKPFSLTGNEVAQREVACPGGAGRGCTVAGNPDACGMWQPAGEH